jgi:truncated hemoglobin YjbI
MAQAKPVHLLDRIGGRRKLSTIVESLYEKVLEDDRLIEFFAGYDVDDLIDHQKRFLSFALTEIPKDYDVLDLIERRHARFFERGLSEKHYDLMIHYLVESLHENRVKQALVNEVVQSVKPYRAAFEEGARKYGGAHGHR